MSKPEALCCAVHRKMHGLPCRCMAMACLSSIAMLSTEGFTPNHPPAHPDRPRTKASSSPHGVERHQRLAKAGVSLLLQGLGVSAPIVASAAPPPGATATLEEVSRLQDKAFSLTNRFNFVEVRAACRIHSLCSEYSRESLSLVSLKYLLAYMWYVSRQIRYGRS